MKFALILVSYFSFCSTPLMAQEFFDDPRDQQKYGVVEAAGLRWMTENLRYAARNSSCYENDTENCENLGRLYPWEIALQSCPDGWHLATEYEWQSLELALGVPFEELQANNERGEPAGEKLKSSSDSKLKFPYAGYGDPDGNFTGKGETAAIWTATEADFNHAWHRDVDIERTGIYRSRVYKPWLLSVRCVANHLEPSLEQE